MNLTSTMPFDLVSIDYVPLEKRKGGTEYLLVIVDHFTQFARAFPTRNKGGRTATEKIFNNYVLRCGFPHRLQLDQGQEFECNLMKHLQQLAGINYLEQPLTIPRGMAKQNAGVELSCLCFGHSLKVRKPTGKIM